MNVITEALIEADGVVSHVRLPHPSFLWRESVWLRLSGVGSPSLSHLSVLLPPQRLCQFVVGLRLRVPSVGAQDVMKMLRQAHDGYVNHTLLPVNLPANGGPTPVQ
eukprot:COSAG04_NODE_6803_length_1252_cov_1.464007_1_plen_105_part_10